ncbi:MAG: HAD family hydrolase, partial [Planctomycetaceae bacterium]
MSHGFLIDMDGVIYRGNQLIPGADRFVEHLLNDDVPFLFLTNNSQRTRRDVATKLRRMGIDGDTMETDILGGVQMGYRTVLVLTGSTGLADLDRY